MTTHTVTLTVATQQQAFAAGTVFGGIKVSLGTLAPVTLTAAPYVATFTEVTPGEYNVTVESVDGAGNVLGTPVTSTVTIAADVQIDIPTAVTSSVA